MSFSLAHYFHRLPAERCQTCRPRPEASGRGHLYRKVKARRRRPVELGVIARRLGGSPFVAHDRRRADGPGAPVMSALAHGPATLSSMCPARTCRSPPVRDRRPHHGRTCRPNVAVAPMVAIMVRLVLASTSSFVDTSDVARQELCSLRSPRAWPPELA